MKPHASKETIQRLIVGKAVEGLLSAGKELSVETGDQIPLLALCAWTEPVMAAIFASEDSEVWLFTFDRGQFVKLVLDNDVDVISDYHTGLEKNLAAANALAEALEA